MKLAVINFSHNFENIFVTYALDNVLMGDLH